MSDTTRFVIEARPAPREDDLEPRWLQIDEFVDQDDAEQEWDRLNMQYGHDTYHRLVRVRRRVLRSA